MHFAKVKEALYFTDPSYCCAFLLQLQVQVVMVVQRDNLKRRSCEGSSLIFGVACLFDEQFVNEST